jgi:hypothetical protein
MARSPNPTALINQRRADWKLFTHWVVKVCAAVAAVLLLMLLFLRIL